MLTLGGHCLPDFSFFFKQRAAMVRVLSSGVCPPIFIVVVFFRRTCRFLALCREQNSDVGSLNPTGIMSNKELNFKFRVSKAIY